MDRTAPVEIEMERLESILRAVLEDTHYHPLCQCPDCRETRTFLSADDLQFVDRTINLVLRANPTLRQVT